MPAARKPMPPPIIQAIIKYAFKSKKCQKGRKVVDAIDENIYGMAKESTGSNVGTGGMATKFAANTLLRCYIFGQIRF